jgi:hypothetical protein
MGARCSARGVDPIMQRERNLPGGFFFHISHYIAPISTSRRKEGKRGEVREREREREREEF